MEHEAEAALMADIGYLKALVDPTVPLSAVPDGITAERIRRAAGVSRQMAGVLLGCGANTILRFEASQVRNSCLLEGSEHYRKFLAALMIYIARTNEAEANAIRRHWRPLARNSTNTNVKVAS